ncbi:hypothetical protein [Streptomyces boninensis]|uniref:hypothetical protein n=1 Tax=Streptomyces boninensis TaxID=2039455 RepID=UPI003B21EE68
MRLRRQLWKLLAEGEQQGRYSTQLPWPSIWLFAKLAYIAEQYGYRYGGLDPDYPRDHQPPQHVFYRLPDAAERTARTERAFPRAHSGGRLPGMFPWRAPLITKPHARREVRLLHARIKVDYFGVLGWERMRGWLFVIPAVILVMILVNGEFHTTGLLIGGGIALVLTALMACSKAFMRLRHASYRRLLEREGIEWPPPADIDRPGAR